MSKNEVEELRALVKTKRRAGRGPFGSEVRERLIAHVKKRWSSGEPLMRVAKDLGLSDHTVHFWRSRWGERDVAVTKLRRVKVVNERPALAKTLTMHGPAGTRIEGLSLEDAAALWRKLA